MGQGDDDPVFKYYIKPFTASPYFDFLDAYLQGLKLETYIKGAETCIMSAVYTADDIMYLFNNLTDFDIRSWEAPVMNVSKIIAGNIANGVFDCTVLWISFDQFAKERFSFF